MNTKQKKQAIKKLVKEMLKDSVKSIESKIDSALNCGALDVEAWSETNAKMVIPKTILVALLENETNSYLGKRTVYENKVRKEANNIKNFI